MAIDPIFISLERDGGLPAIAGGIEALGAEGSEQVAEAARRAQVSSTRPSAP